jgi:hypothetical protein
LQVNHLHVDHLPVDYLQVNHLQVDRLQVDHLQVDILLIDCYVREPSDMLYRMYAEKSYYEFAIYRASSSGFISRK